MNRIDLLLTASRLLNNESEKKRTKKAKDLTAGKRKTKHVRDIYLHKAIKNIEKKIGYKSKIRKGNWRSSRPMVTVFEKDDKKFKKQCTACGSQNTPFWRTGPRGEGTLCNSCGLNWKKNNMVIDVESGGVKSNDMVFSNFQSEVELEIK